MPAKISVAEAGAAAGALCGGRGGCGRNFACFLFSYLFSLFFFHPPNRPPQKWCKERKKSQIVAAYWTNGVQEARNDVMIKKSMKTRFGESVFQSYSDFQLLKSVQRHYFESGIPE
jgi:hypothetical protein